MSRVWNFGPGPATLPVDVLREAATHLVDHHGAGMSLLEMSHRSPAYAEVHQGTVAAARELLDVPDDFAVLLLQGGATLQFSMAPANLLDDGQRCAVAVTGSWSAKALADARAHAHADVAWDGAPDHPRAPAADELDLSGDPRYVHVCSNETIEGVRFAEFPDAGVPLVADMSSDIATRPLPWDRFDVVYAGAQKNLGPAGLTLVIVRRAAVPAERPDLGAYLRYGTHIAKDSLYNTPPVFAVWLTGMVLRWMLDAGGMKAMADLAERRAAIVYGAVDDSDGFYDCPVEPGSRSLTNVVFRLPDAGTERRFLSEAAGRDLVGLKGHRSVGGCRASLYNALPVEGAEVLADFMRDFRRRA